MDDDERWIQVNYEIIREMKLICMVFNAIYISAISWQSVLLVEEKLKCKILI